MGLTYLVLPSDAPLRAWLTELGLTVTNAADGRLPHPDEIRAVLSRLAGYDITVAHDGTDTFHATIRSVENPDTSWTTLSFPQADHEQPTGPHLAFHKGSPELMIEIVKRLSHVAGPQALILEGRQPLLIDERADVGALITTWSTAPRMVL